METKDRPLVYVVACHPQIHEALQGQSDIELFPRRFSPDEFEEFITGGEPPAWSPIVIVTSNEGGEWCSQTADYEDFVRRHVQTTVLVQWDYSCGDYVYDEIYEWGFDGGRVISVDLPVTLNGLRASIARQAFGQPSKLGPVPGGDDPLAIDNLQEPGCVVCGKTVRLGQACCWCGTASHESCRPRRSKGHRGQRCPKCDRLVSCSKCGEALDEEEYPHQIDCMNCGAVYHGRCHKTDDGAWTIRPCDQCFLL